MLHEILPHRLHNEYKPSPIKTGDVILCFNGDEILLCIDKEEAVPPLYSQKDEKYGTDNFIFLFKIDDTGYYLAPKGYEKEGFYYEKLLRLREMKPMHTAFAGLLGAQLYRWYSQNRFCGQCGGKMHMGDRERSLICNDCQNTVYPKISPCIIAAVCDGNRLVLTKYNGRSYKKYTLIAGFMEIGESPEDTVRREVMEEAGLRVKNITYYKSQPWPVTDTLLIGFFCEVDGSRDIKIDTEELCEGAWFEREKIPEMSADVSLTNEMIEVFRAGKEPV